MDLDELIAQIENSGRSQQQQPPRRGTQTYAAAKNDEHLRGVLERLEALGELMPSEKAELERLRAGSAQAQETIGSTHAAYRGALQGATFQQADEIYGLFGGDKEAARERNRAAEEAFPREYRRGKTGGAIATGLGTAAVTAPYAAGATLLGTAARGAGIGATEGFLWGSGGAEGVDEKLRDGVKHGLWGVGLGATAPYAVHYGAKGLRATSDAATGLFGLGNQGRAERHFMEGLRRSGQSVDDVTGEIALAARQGQPEFRIMDAMGMAGQRQTSGIVRGGGDGAEEIAAYLRQRQLDQPDRIAGFIDDAYGTSGTTAARAKDAMIAERGRVADTAFEAARGNAAPVDVRNALAAIDARIGGMQGSNIAGDGIDARLAGFRNRLAANPAPEGEIARELSDFDRVMGVKQDVQDAIGTAVRAGRNNEARELGKLASELDAALEQSSAGYRAANDGFREASRAIDAVDTGAQMASRGRGADNAALFGGMTTPQQDAARLGYGDALLGRLERATAPTANHAKPLSSTKAQTEAGAIASDPSLLSARIARENQMWETQNRALGGSRTADNLQDINDTGLMASVLRSGRDVASGNLGNAAANALSATSNVLQGRNEATRQLMARILMSNDPQAALAGALRREARGQRVSRGMEAITRALAREHLVPN